MPENSNPTSQQAIAERVFNSALSLSMEFSRQREGDIPERLQPVLLEFIAAAEDAIPLCQSVPAGWSEVCFYLAKLGMRAHKFKKLISSPRSYKTIPKTILERLIFEYSDDYPEMYGAANVGLSVLRFVHRSSASDDPWNVYARLHEELDETGPNRVPNPFEETNPPVDNPSSDSNHKPKLKNWGIGTEGSTKWILFHKKVVQGKVIWQERGSLHIPRGNQSLLLWEIMMKGGSMDSSEAIKLLSKSYPGKTTKEILRSVTLALGTIRNRIKEPIAERVHCSKEDVEDPIPHGKAGWRVSIEVGLIEKNDFGGWDFKPKNGLKQ